MKIIEVPSAAPWSMKASCNRCSTRVEVEIGDFTKSIDDQRDGRAVSFACPTCTAEVWVAASLIPQSLHYKLPR